VITGLKILQRDRTSLNGQFRYAPKGKWNTVPGNGSYVAITGGLWSNGFPPADARYWVVECEEPTLAFTPRGVECYRRVRLLRRATEKDIDDYAEHDMGAALCYAAKLLTPERRLRCERRR
jgi:hypothetical protein